MPKPRWWWTAQSARKSAPSLCYGPALVSARRTRSAARLAGASIAIVLAGVSVAAAAGPGDSLKNQVSTLQSRTHRALLDLYALDTRFQTAQLRLASLEAQAERLHRQQSLLEQQLSATSHTLKVSQQQLGANLRMLYKQGDVSALAVVLGAQNLDEAVTKLDALSSVTDESQQVVQATADAQLRLDRIRSTLLARRSALAADVADAQRTARRWPRRAPNVCSFIAQLRKQQRLKTAQIDALQAAAARVERKSNKIQAAAAIEAVDAPVSTSAPSSRLLRHGRSRSARPGTPCRATRPRASPSAGA